MASILDLLKTQTGSQLISKAKNETSYNDSEIKALLGAALPLLVSVMVKNSKSSEGAKNLNEALADPRHNGDLLQNLSSAKSNMLEQEGGKILNHVLGNNQGDISKVLANTLDLDANSVTKVLKIAAPVLLSILGNQKRKDNVNEGSISDLIGSVLGANSSHDRSFLETILDKDNDGNIIDDIGGIILGGGLGNKKGGGSILGGYAGGR
ncbi:DUF937 domain-containing protein [Gramella sp. AN32]|uniref:DUF937 domain-containing protein n=1 Tax=Christiangramia antarctica TaxID=2058158 RepID=A0ABW5X7Y2_9FLAO|nr:DUF937 domain-containing protein [Gramella sp. AN32]MCM4157422.1 hypothetical protein [Gramella sp. AN32]